MMRLFRSLLASSKASPKQPLLVLERSVAAYYNLVNTTRSYERRFFSAPPDQEFRFSPPMHDGVNGAKEKSTIGIRVMSIQHVKPDKPTPENHRSYKLSAIDQINTPNHVPFVFFYANKNNIIANENIDNLVVERSKLLRDSLSETLTRFYPFAGKYIDDNHIDCNDEGVYYIETRIDSDLSSFLTKPDYMLLQRLLPTPPNPKDEPTRGYYLSMIQVNFFSCGGVGISVANSHKLIDATTTMTFFNAWASLAKGDDHDPEKMVHRRPVFGASSLFLPNTERPTNILASFPLSFLAVWPIIYKRGKCATKRFRFDASALQALKAKAATSRVVAVTSLIWKCATTAARKVRGESRPSIIRTAVSLRSRCTPPLPSNAIRNIIWNTVVRCESNDNLELETVAGRIKDSIAKVDTNFVDKFTGEQGSDNVFDELQWLAGQFAVYGADCYSSSSVCNSGLYDADFGWGRPTWTTFGFLCDGNPLYSNAIILMDTREGDGIEAWVTLSQREMDLLERDPHLLLYASVEPSPLEP